jgi:hypothetical protein
MPSFLHFLPTDGEPRACQQIVQALAARNLTCEEYAGETFALGFVGSHDTLYLTPSRDVVKRVAWSPDSRHPRDWDKKIIDALHRVGFEYHDEDDIE